MSEDVEDIIDLYSSDEEDDDNNDSQYTAPLSPVSVKNNSSDYISQ
jgi:hypothetical protein